MGPKVCLMNTLNVNNFIDKIKAMEERDLQKLEINGLIELILQLPITPPPTSDIIKIQETIAEIREISLRNSQEIISLKDDNLRINRINKELSVEVTRLTTENIDLKSQLDGVDQYLRINNLEISGLSDPITDETNRTEPLEDVLLECLNGLNLDVPITSKDIDTSHELPRREGKTHVIRFLSRKSKDAILRAKKDPRNHSYKFRGDDIYVNEHLTGRNKNLFRLAKIKKRTLGYKYLWTRSGKVFMRKLDNTPVLEITSEEIHSFFYKKLPQHPALKVS